MVSLTLSITVSRSSLDNHPPPPPPQYPASLYSNHSHSNSKPYAYSLNNLNIRSSRNSSLEQLLSKEKIGSGSGRFENKHLAPARGLKKGSSKMTGNMEIVERKKSYGIGGAGNIRRPSEVIYPPRTNSDGTRRRSSGWSISAGTSPEGKRSSIFSIFRRGNSQPEATKNESALEVK